VTAASYQLERWFAELEKMSAYERGKADLLGVSLAVAVPLWIDRYRDFCWEEGYRRAQICMQVCAEHGDDILYRTKGKTADGFNRLAEGLAILASSPGGVTFAGQHWEAPPLRTLAQIVADLDARAAAATADA
jgi:hypothetical protein